VCVEAKSNLVIVLAAIIVVDHPSSSAGSSYSVDEATVPRALAGSEPADKAVRALITPCLEVQPPLRVQRSGYLVTIALASLGMSGAARQTQSDVAEQIDLRSKRRRQTQR
jgi:hypothetical protein